MDNSFILTDIARIAFIDKHEYPEKRTNFSHLLYNLYTFILLCFFEILRFFIEPFYYNIVFR